MNIFKSKFSEILNLVILLVIVFAVVSIFSKRDFLSSSNFLAMATQMGEFGVFTLGMLVVMLTGGINLSIVTSAAFTGIIMGVIMNKLVRPESTASEIFLIVIFVIIVAICISIFIGLINGLLVGFIGVPAIIATLGMLTLIQGTSVVITKAGAVSGFPQSFLTIAAARFLGIPIPFLIFVICVIFVALYLNKTVTGFSIYMVGSNEKVTSFSGINNRMIILKSHIISGFLSGIGGIIMTARFNSARSDFGGSYLLQTILVILLGGVSASGGAGSVVGVVIAIIILQFLASGFNLLGISPFLTTAIWGLMLILAIVMNYYRDKYQKAVKI